VATYIFADLERLAPADLERAAGLWHQLEESGAPVRLLNHPLRALRRYDLLRTLHEHGINGFDVYRLTEPRRPARFPVFIRGENDHDGSQTGLIASQEELDETVRRLMRDGPHVGQRIVTEYLDAGVGEGRYLKYGAFRVGDRIVPRHRFISEKWVVKGPTVREPDIIDAERAYVAGNPHAAELSRI